MQYFIKKIKGFEIEFEYNVIPSENSSFWSPGYDAEIIDLDWDDSLNTHSINDYIIKHTKDIKEEIKEHLQEDLI